MTFAFCRGERALWLLPLVFALSLPACGAPREYPPGGTKLVPDLVLSGPELFKPTDVAIDGARRIYVLDAGNYRLFEYSASGELEAQRGRRGQGPEEYPFLAENSSEVAVDDGTGVVMMPDIQRLLVWDLAKGTAHTFRIVPYPVSLALRHSTVYVTLYSSGAPEIDASVYAYSLDGALVAKFGDRFRPDWEDLSTHRAVSTQTRSVLAASPQGVVFEAGQFWPWLRAYDEQTLLWEKWLDYSWLESPPLRDIQGRKQADLADFSYEDILEDPINSSQRVFDIAASDESIFALLGTSLHLQVFDHEANPTATYWLLPDGVDPDTAPTMRPLPTPQAWAIGVSPDGSRLCTASHQTAKVLCYNLGAN